MSLAVTTLVVFISQFLFIWFRTWNVKAISNKDLRQVIVSGALIHIAWVASITLVTTSMIDVVQEKDLSSLVVVLGSLSGGLAGSVMAFREKFNK